MRTLRCISDAKINKSNTIKANMSRKHANENLDAQYFVDTLEIRLMSCFEKAYERKP